jgi:rare lipoprotein A
MKRLVLILLALSLTVHARLGMVIPISSGKASWYGDREAGKKTANGEIFDPRKDTCASRVYPMNTLLRIYYPKTQKHVIVRVNDRGPWVKGRVIDLSEHAAKTIGLKEVGVDYVFITRIGKNEKV